MNLSVGIVGLPNVGKSTLFNALTKLNALAANYPFATIDPNIGIVEVYDERLDMLHKISGSKIKKPATIKFVDIAGLVKGASEGNGLGNKFLGYIKEVGLILHLVRVFKDSDIIHVEGSINPKRDIEIINSELILKDLETLTKRINEINVKFKSDKSNKNLEKYLNLLINLKNFLNSGNLANKFKFDSEEEINILNDLHLITIKPIIYVANIDTDYSVLNQNYINELYKILGLDTSEIVIPLNVKLESELLILDANEQMEYLSSMGCSMKGIDKITQLGYKTLDLITFFTTGEKETRGWTIKRYTNAKDAAGVIHTDFQKNFVAVDVVPYDDFVKCGSWLNARSKGLVKLEGKDYIIQDGDVVIFKHNS